MKNQTISYHHVRVPDGFHFVHIIILYYRIEARIQVVQKIHHLKNIQELKTLRLGVAAKPT